MEYTITIKRLDSLGFAGLWQVTLHLNGKDSLLYRGIHPGKYLATNGEAICNKIANEEADNWLTNWLAEHSE